jgi:hypothetical protein|tara:strand:+ start:2035 stop:2307 length:273 start_codon:yes stop_codon:yes gene_type:complete
MSDAARLDRIEDELKKLTEAIVALARVEERLITLFKRMEVYDAEQQRHNTRLNHVERHVGSNGQALRFAERVFWIVTAAGITFFFKTTGG